MSQLCKIVLVGGDLRQYYMAQQLHHLGYPVTVYGLDLGEQNHTIYEASSLKEALSFGNIVVCPVPCSKNNNDIYSNQPRKDLTLAELILYLNDNHTIFGGCICNSLKEYCSNQHIPFCDFIEVESFSIANAIATAEGALVEAIKVSPFVMHKNRCLVLGFGRCAKILADKLKGIGAKVTIAARSIEALAYANAYGYDTIPINDLSKYLDSFLFIFNSIPSMVLDAAELSFVQKEAILIDIASAPGGINYDYCRQLHLHAYVCSSLPGKYAPQTSALILNDVLLTHLNSLTSS
jgi:dipicolinate synthase subunit A